MKNYIYKNPIVSSVVVNSTSSVMAVKSLNSEKFLLLIPLIITYYFNKIILIKGENLNKIKKIILLSIYFIMVFIIFIFNKYILSSIM
ncbi:MAG: hypothetical protein GX275_02880 [Clostridiales bacterium]|nr:hypothetical protein [Clostridiales bacterium]